MLETLSLFSAAILAMVHIVSGRFTALHGTPRSRWLSFGGGLAVAYVFVHLLPEVNELQNKTEERYGSGHWYWRHHLYLVGVAGLALFYAIEVAAKRTRQPRSDGEDRSALVVFWPHMGLLFLYTGFIGYFLVHRASDTFTKLLIFTIILALHLAGTDRALREDYKSLYQQIGRWVLAGGVLAGWIFGRFSTLQELPYGIILAVLAGGVTLNAIKEELPQEQKTRLWPFLVGSIGCAFALAAIQ